MKTLLIAITTLLFTGTLNASDQCGNCKEAPEAFQKQLTVVVDQYLTLKDALAGDQEEAAVDAAEKTIEALKKVDMELVKGESHMQWMEQYRNILSNLNGIVNMSGLEMKRSHFVIVSKNLSEAVKNFGISSDKPVYLDFCPMADNNNGGYWLSRDKEIRNPYFGAKMMTCGEVTETLNR